MTNLLRNETGEAGLSFWCTMCTCMKDEIYDDIEIERLCKDRFGVDFEIGQVIVRGVPISRTADATVFLTKKKQLFVYISARSRLVLGDISKLVARMGLKAEVYFPPVGNPDYFNVIGREKFEQVFPGRTYVADDELRFYRTLAPYNPARPCNAGQARRA